jgi:hypothetical protein
MRRTAGYRVGTWTGTPRRIARAVLLLASVASFRLSFLLYPLYRARPAFALESFSVLLPPGFVSAAAGVLVPFALVVLGEALQRRRVLGCSFRDGLDESTRGYLPLVALLPCGLLLLPGAPGTSPLLLWVALEGRSWLATVAFAGALALKLRGPLQALGRSLSRRTSLRALPATVGVAVALFAILIALTPRERFHQTYDERFGTGDEPRYVRLAASLLHDGDTDVSNAAEQVGRPFSLRRTARGVGTAAVACTRALVEAVGVLAGSRVEGRPHPLGGQVVAGRRGGEYYVYLPGFPLLIAPALALDSLVAPEHLRAAIVTCLLLATANAFALARLVELVLGDRHRIGAWALTVGLVLTPPLFAHAFQLYPEIAASLCLTSFLIVLLGSAPCGRLSLVSVALAAALMPWLHTKYLPLWAVSMAALAFRGRREGSRFALPLALGAVSIGLLALYMFSITGSVLPDALWVLSGYPRGAELVNRQTARGLYYLFFGRSEGLLVYAPHYLLGLAGLLALRRFHRFGFWLSLLLLVPYILIAASHDQGGAGGWSPPARYFVPVTPIFALGLASFLREGASRARVGALVALSAASFWIGLGMLSERNFLYDRSAYLASGALDPSPLLGSSADDEPVARRIAYPALLLAGFLLFRLAEKKDARLAWIAAGVALLVAVTGEAALFWAPAGSWTPGRARIQVVRPGRSAFVVVRDCPAPALRLEGSEDGPTELEVSAHSFERGWVVPPRETMLVDVDVDVDSGAGYLQWRGAEAIEWKLIALRVPENGERIRVEGVCPGARTSVLEGGSRPR